MSTCEYVRKPLAHSPPEVGMTGDPYGRHVISVRDRALSSVRDMLQYASEPLTGLPETIETAALFHDLGKLDPDNQESLEAGRGKKLEWDHVDAGVAHLSNAGNWMAAWLVRAHHRPGLPQRAEHFTEKTDRHLRGRRFDSKSQEEHQEQIDRTDLLMKQYLAMHESIVGTLNVQPKHSVHGLTMRLALSCLVDADYTDSAYFDTDRELPDVPKTKWAERLEALTEYVRHLPYRENEAERDRNRIRQQFFEACLSSTIDEQMLACEGPVGIGKTTAVVGYLVKKALANNLRRLVIVAPYTSILSQTSEVLRAALTLPGEDPERIVIEHHHRADFSHRESREYSILWHAPVILTTSVSFFETLAACDPASLRKLHRLPGSAILLDEAHAALPTRLLPQNWNWMSELASKWGCRVVFASGSLVRFWEDGRIVNPPTKLPELMPDSQTEEIFRIEHRRVEYAQAAGGRILDVSELVDLVCSERGPRLIILNTVQNAAVVAKAMRDLGLDVLHVSTALTPFDRDMIIKRVKRRLQFKGYRDWTLVATSCVEAGVNLSFRCAFRERFTAASTIQVGGRVNRNGEYDEHGGGKVFDFALLDDLITQNPDAEVASGILREIMKDGLLNCDNPSDVVTLAMKREIQAYGGITSDPLAKAEAEQNYPAVKETGRVINADTRFVIIDAVLQERLKRRLPITFRELLSGSVQLWSSRVDSLGLVPLSNSSEIYCWNDDYDPEFLGYMSGVLRNEAFLRDNEAWII